MTYLFEKKHFWERRSDDICGDKTYIFILQTYIPYYLQIIALSAVDILAEEHSVDVMISSVAEYVFFWMKKRRRSDDKKASVR